MGDLLISCDDCGNLVSLRAVTCPNCGSLVQTQAGVKAKLAEIKKKQEQERNKIAVTQFFRLMGNLFSVLGLFMAYMCFDGGKPFFALIFLISAFLSSSLVKDFLVKKNPQIKRIVYTLASIAILVLGMIILKAKAENQPVSSSTTEETVASAPAPVVASTPSPPQKAKAIKEDKKPKEKIKAEKDRKTDGNIKSGSTPMGFTECVKQQSAWSDFMSMKGYKVAPIMINDQVSIVRYCTDEGSVIITCSNPDQKRVVTQSPHMEDCQ